MSLPVKYRTWFATATIVIMAVSISLPNVASARAPSLDNPMFELRLGNETIEGMPLAWDARQVHLLGRDGRLWNFDPAEAAEFRKTADRFQSYSISKLRAMLLRELGSDFEVTSTGHYLIAHPRGGHDQWPERFEELYRAFVHYFSVRGFQIEPPFYPLLGVVCHDRDEFVRYSTRDGWRAGGGMLGYYHVKSNRIALYDMPEQSGDWQQNAAIAIHEATHQTAFNTGIHSRHAPPPTWVAEGLATMFEAPGTYDSRHHPHRTDRIHHAWLARFRAMTREGHRLELLSDIIASDNIFHTHPSIAYAEAWALTFYLIETQPGKYATYLARTANRPAFEPYAPAARVADFTAVFGNDWRMIEARFLRFIESLP